MATAQKMTKSALFAYFADKFEVKRTQVRDIFDRYGLTYHAASLPKQVASAWHKVLRLSLPNDFLGTNATPAPLAKPADQAASAARPAWRIRRSGIQAPMSPGRSNRSLSPYAEPSGVRTLLLLTGLWGGLSWAVLRPWHSGRAGARRDEHVKWLLSGALVPVARQSTEQLDPAGR